MMKKIACLLALVLCAALLSSGALAGDAVKMAIVYSNTTDDQGWCQSMDNGVKAAIETLAGQGVTLEYTPVESILPADGPATVRQLVGQGYDLIICHGAQFKNAVTDVAEEYEDVVFAYGTSGEVEGDNIFTYMPQSEETGYLNGIVAGMSTKTSKIGLVGPVDGGDAYRYIRGFKLGVQAANPDAQVMIAFTNSFDDTVGAGELAASFVEAGADVLAGAAQQALGALRVVAEHKDEDIWWVAQEFGQMEGTEGFKTISAAAYDYSAVILTLVERMQSGVTGGECIPLNYNNGGFRYQFNAENPMATDEVKTAVEAALAGLTAQAGSDAVAGFADVAVQ